MQRFADMPERQIMQIAGEIALVGNTGIDYTDAAKKYTLRFLPGEEFSGLQLLSLMYVGFKKVNPELDTGLLSIRPGETLTVALKMSDEFEGKFTVKALDPATQKSYDRLDLETDYTV
jgi:hypothetical protein